MNLLKFAFRTLAKTPFLTGLAVMSLGLGIGANGAIFSLFDQILLKPLPVNEPQQLVNLSAPGPKSGRTSCTSEGSCEDIFSYAMFKDLQGAETGLSGIALHRTFGANLATTESTTSGAGLWVSGNYFTLLGVQPALGRLLGPSDDERFGGHPVAVLSYRYWDRQLGQDPSVLNSTIVVNGQPLTVIGVAASDFDGTTLGFRPDVFVPVTMRAALTPTWDDFDNRRSYGFYLMGRLPDGVSIEQAGLAINLIYSGILNEVEAPLQEGMSDSGLQRFKARQIVLEDGFRGQSSIQNSAGAPLAFLLGVTGLVLIIACANIANLLLARGAGRAREMAIRGSMGASRRHLLGQLVTESTILATLGGLAGVVVARWTLTFMIRAIPPDELGGLTASLSPSVLGFTAALALSTGFLFGLYPALNSSKQDLVSMLKAGGGQPSAGRRAARFRATLVTTQIAISMTLLITAGLFIRSLVNVSTVDLGIHTENVVTFGLSPELNGYGAERTMAFFQEVERDLAAIPGVTGVTAALVPLMSGSSWGSSMAVEGFDSGPDTNENSRMNSVGPGYFSAMGMPLIAGREFSESDVTGAPEVVIVNEAFVKKFNLNAREAVGTFISDEGFGSETDMQIVGVVQDATYSDVKQVAEAVFFTAYRQQDWIGWLTFYVHADLDPSQIIGAIPPAVARLDPNLPVESIKSMETVVRENTFADRLISTLAAAFAVLATLLASIGLYGVLAYTVAQRTREIGVRMALGAQTQNVSAMVLKQVGRMAVIGGVIGIAGSIALARAAQALLFGMEGTDPLMIIAVSLILGMVVFAAAYLPARRASRVNPIQALQSE